MKKKVTTGPANYLPGFARHLIATNGERIISCDNNPKMNRMICQHCPHFWIANSPSKVVGEYICKQNVVVVEEEEVTAHEKKAMDEKFPWTLLQVQVLHDFWLSYSLPSLDFEQHMQRLIKILAAEKKCKEVGL